MNSTKSPPDSIFKLHNRDVRDLKEVLRSYSRLEKFVDVTITSPPYYDLKTYGYENQIGYGQEFSEYLKDIVDIFNQIYYITNDLGSLWIVADTFSKNGTFVNLPFEISERIRKGRNRKGWNLTDVIIWKKDKTLPWARKGQFRNIFEYILFFTKSENYRFNVDEIRAFDPYELKEWWVKFPERYNPKGAVPNNVWEHPIPTQGTWNKKQSRHSNPLPTGIIEKILLLTTELDDVVFDPFAGSGTVLAVADFLKRRWFGFEMNQHYCTMFEKNVLSMIERRMAFERKRKMELEGLRKQFEDTIKKLRLNKLPKALIRELLKKKTWNADSKWINTVFVVAKKLTRNDLLSLPKTKFMTEDIYLISNFPPDSGFIEKQIGKAISNPPLSKFGIKPSVCILSMDEFLQKKAKELKSSEFWLYSGVVNKFSKKITFSEWSLESKKPEWSNYYERGVPPIVSNVMVSQDVPKTWKSREEKFEEARGFYKKSIDDGS